MSDEKIIGGINIMGFVAPNSIYDTYPVIDPLYGIDGLRNVTTIDEMMAIPDERRRAGMIVGINGGDRFFKLKDKYINHNKSYNDNRIMCNESTCIENKNFF